MSTGFGQPADIMEYTAPTGGVTKGVPVLIGGLFVIPADTASAGASFRGKTTGLFTAAKATGEAWAQEQPLFWDVANARATVDQTVGLPIGTVGVAALSADATGSVRLHGGSLAGRVIHIRKRFTVAQVNAGATLIPAIPGAKIRLLDAAAIAIGGAVTSVTTVDILATLSSASRKLVAFAQANLTQSALLRAGATGGTILADGASFTANDAGTGVTVGITGAAITVATNVDFIATYQLE
jgi:predicted RecA/RadA family phage recombinase